MRRVQPEFLKKKAKVEAAGATEAERLGIAKNFSSFSNFSSGQRGFEDSRSSGGEDVSEPPRPLVRPSEPATPYPVEELGECLGAAARAIHDKTRAPLAICGSSVLAAAALAAQSFVDVVLPTGQKRPLSLYLLTVAISGERKTSADNEALWPINDRESELREKEERETYPYENAMAAWKAEKQSILTKKEFRTVLKKEEALNALGPPPMAPLLPMLTVPEPTYEGLCRLLEHGQPSIGVFSSEGGQFIGGHAMNADNKLKTVAAMSSVWDSGIVKRLRAGDGSKIMPGRRVSLHLMAQPDIAAIMITDPLLLEQGILSRLLITAPDFAAGTRFWREPQPESDTALRRYYNKLLGILRTTPPLASNGTGPPKPNELKPRLLPLSADARALWVAFADAVETDLAPNGSLRLIMACANKLPEQAARVAGVLAVIDGGTQVVEISEEYLASAINIVKHHAAETLRMARAGSVAPEIMRAKELLNWLAKDWTEVLVSLPDIYQRGPAAIRDKKSAAQTVAILVDHGWLSRVEGPHTVGGVTRREVWAIHGKRPT